MKLIPDLPKWALEALDAPSAFADTDRADMGTAFGLDGIDTGLMPPPIELTPEEQAAVDAAAQDPLQRRLTRRTGL